MKSAFATATLVASTALLAATTVHGHGYVHIAKFKPGVMNTNYNAIIDSSKLPAPFAGKKWNDNPAANVATFTAAFKESSYKSLKELADKSVSDCGNTLTDGPPVDVSNMKELVFSNDQEKKGFITSHTGPCEIWIDNTQVMHEDNCVGKFTDYPAKIPVDYSKCKGKCTLTFYWLALHEANWQVYKQCAPIQNNSGGGGDDNNKPTPAPGPAPSPSSNPQPNPTPAPGPGPAPTPTKKHCTRKPRRRALRNE